MDGPVGLIRVTQLYAWGVFLSSWAQLGWVDWREQKIRNQYVVFWLKLILLGYALLLGQSLLGELGVVEVFVLRGYYPALLGHAAISIAAACALWRLRIWPAGDVKLFVLLALCYPLMKIPGSFRSGLLFLEVLINVFVPAAAFLFLTAGEYLWRTRFAHYKAHFTTFVRSYYKDFRLPEFGGDFDPAERARSGFAAVRIKSAELWFLIKKEILGWLRGWRDNPKQFVIDVLSWFAMMAVMSMISYYLNGVITSNVLKTLICFALMFTWSRLCQLISTGRALGLMAGVCALLLWRYPHVDIPALAVIFGHITIFSLFIFVGVQLAFKIIAGKTTYVFLPVLMMLPGLVPWRAVFLTVWSWIAALAGALSLPGLPPLPALQLPWGPAFDMAGLVIWAFMGLLFGLALVFVKIWDDESFKSVPVAHVERFMTLGPSLIARIEADEEFRDEHFTTFYADGITGEQAEALKEWCREEGIDMVPLEPTISFANWIFLGYLLTRLLEGHVLRFLY